jgi:transcription initiation factor TFIIIB Brf1 subunit/transcription initiation factor TFIIB
MIIAEHTLLSIEQIKNTPSRKENIDEQLEDTMRVFGCNLIQDAGILLKLPQRAIARAQVLFHRLYQTVSMKDHDIVFGGMAALLLAGKMEEVAKPIYDLIEAFKKIERLPTFCSKMNNMQIRTEVIRTERYILVELGFILHDMELPHRYIFFYLHILEGNDQLAQCAWNYCNDSLRSAILCLTIKPQVIACGAIYIASKRLGIKLPENPPWWLLFETTREDLEKVSQLIENLYNQPKATYTALTTTSQELTEESKQEISPSKESHHSIRDSHRDRKYRDDDSRSRRDSRDRDRDYYRDYYRDPDDRRRDDRDRYRSSYRSERDRRSPDRKRSRRNDR